MSDELHATFCSRIRRAMSRLYCDPKSRTAIASRLGGDAGFDGFVAVPNLLRISSLAISR
jgi:hypothetical protein